MSTSWDWTSGQKHTGKHVKNKWKTFGDHRFRAVWHPGYIPRTERGTVGKTKTTEHLNSVGFVDNNTNKMKPA